MHLDLTGLSRKVGDHWVACSPDVITSSSAFPTHTIDSKGPFLGALMVGDDTALTALKVDGTLVSRVLIQAASAKIILVLPSPVPGYRNTDSLEFVLQYTSTGAWVVQLNSVGWFKQATSITGGLGDWLNRSGTVLNMSQTSSHGPYYGFPLHQLGIATSPGIWTYTADHRGWIGLLRPTGGGPEKSVAVFVPAGVNTTNEIQAVDGLKLAGLSDVKLGRGAPFTMLPVALACPLYPDGRDAIWRAVVQWRPIVPQLSTKKVNRLQLEKFAEAIWNDPVRASLRGAHQHSAGGPLIPAPILELQFDEGDADAPVAQPLLVFDIPSPRQSADAARAQARLRRIEFSASAPTPVTATLNWQSGPVGLPKDAGTVTPPGHLQGTTIAFTGKLPANPIEGWTALPDTEHALTVAQRLEKACAALDDPAHSDLLLELDLQGSIQAPAGKWIRWGSFEILPGADARLLCRLRGTWTADDCDLYPESDLRLQGCKVRPSVLADSAGRDLRAMFDTLDLAEDALQRETDPLRYRRREDEGIPCDIRIRHLAQPGRMAASRVEVFSTAGISKLGTESLYLQIRPFVVALTQPAEIDTSAGELIAIWSSDDPEGQQWRVPDQTVQCVLPPQAIGEAMERGVRFWDDATGSPSPTLNPAKPVPFRFSPPTRLTVRPSVRDRRYNTSPSNLALALNGAKVDSFVTEIVYPVQTEFKVSDLSLPDIRVQETAAYLGRPAPNLPLMPRYPGADDKPWRRDVRLLLESVMADEAAYYASRLDAATPEAPLRVLADSIGTLRQRHAATRATFAARLAEFHVYDPFRRDGALHLSQGLNFRIRDRKHGAPPLSNPLPRWRLDYGTPVPPLPFAPKLNPVDLTAGQKTEVHSLKQGLPEFLKEDAAGAIVWGDPTSDGAIPAGVLHTIEFPSELVAILRNPTSAIGSIDTLSWSALGATGGFQCSFDEGRTTFIAEARHGQLSRLLKVRIGRVAVLWNKAKHIIVYERTTVPSEQFEDEQELGVERSRGWPVLRKTEEYVEPIEPVRSYDASDSESGGVPGCVIASEFISPRIYVNGAWGRDVGHGYEIPLWNLADTSGFYPKPSLALQVHAAKPNRTRCAHERPEHLYFYSNTEIGTGNDPDRWVAKRGLDCPTALARAPVVTHANKDKNEVLDATVLPTPRLGGTERPRFDFLVTSDGKANIQHGRGETEMLANLQIISLARTSAPGTQEDDMEKVLRDQWDDIVERCEKSSDVQMMHEVEAQISSVLEKGIQTLLGAPKECVALKKKLHGEIDRAFDKVGSNLLKFPTLTVSVPSFSVDALNRVEAELVEFERVLRVPFASLRADIQRARASARGEAVGFVAGVKLQIAAGRAQIDQAFELAARRLKALQKQLDEAQGSVQGTVQKVGTVIANAEAAINGYLAELAQAVPDPAKLRAQLAEAKIQINRLNNHPTVGGAARRLVQFIAAADGCLAVSGTIVAEVVQRLQGAMSQVATKLKACVGVAATACSDASTALNVIYTRLEAKRKSTRDDLQNRLTEIEHATGADIDAILARTLATLDSVAAAMDATAAQVESTVLGQWSKETGAAIETLRTNVALPLDGALGAVAEKASALAAAAAQLLNAAAGSTANWLAEARDLAHVKLDTIDCNKVQETAAAAEAAVRAVLRDAEAQIRERVTGLTSALIDDDVRQSLGQLEEALKDKEKFEKVAASGLKLVKALGEIPALPHLDFNTALAEYSFDDIEKQINTSPFAAKLREIDSGLKDLGLAVPARRLLDQVIPDSLKDFDFNKVFRNFAGLDFQDFFKRFKLPAIESDAVRITHGIDKASRSAWAKADVDVQFPEENTLFEFSALAVRLAKMKLEAHSKTSVGGESQSSIQADLQADWGLDFGGARLATFREVAVHYDGSKFDFDISPEKVDLHPSVKFVSEIAKQFTPDLPPGVELLKDARGVPIGAKAQMSHNLVLPSIGAVEIGPLLIASGLTLEVQPTGKFKVATHLSLGSSTAPVWVQIGYLGGGLWLEAKATYRDRISYSASLGVAIGSAKALNVAGVARGSYSLLLFVYADISDTGGSLRAGFSMSGSARILGIANASLDLLLEVVHKDGGQADGHGTLDVEIDICWCYSIHVRTGVQQKVGG